MFGTATARSPGSLLQPPSTHVHGPSCGHDHAGNDHAGHDHDHDHDHAGHDHDHDHDHAGHDHDHAGHDHVHGPSCGHDHDHDHAGHDHHEVHPPGARACDGQPAVQLDLAAALPGETDEVGRFAQLARELAREVHVTRVHLTRDAGWAEVCVHHTAPDAAPILAIAETTARRAAKRYLGKTWFVRGMDSAQCGLVIEHVLRRTPGVLSADVAYAAERLVVEYDAQVVSEGQLEKRIDAMGYALEVPSAGHACSHHAHSGGLAPRWEMPLTVAAGALLALGVGLGWFGVAPAT
ncbi:MAG: cation transporter, partial [Myxococcota bacterium]